MKIQVDSSRLAKACSLASKNIPGKTTIAIIENLHIVAESGMLRISSTDMETWVVYDVPAEVTFSDSPKAFCVQADNITNLLMNIPSQPITIELHKSKNTATSYSYVKVKHSCGTSELPVVSADEYPTLKPIVGENHSMPAEVLRKSIATCSFALYNDAEAKPELASLCLDFKGKSLVAVCSDGHRMARMEHPDMEGEACKYLLPRKTLTLLKPALDDVLKDKDAMDVVLIRKDSSNVCVQMATATIYFRQTERRYPNYDSVIPRRDTMQLQAVMNRQDLLSAINRASIFANPAEMKLMFKFDGLKDHVLVCGQCIDFSTSSEEKVKCEFTDGKVLTIALKATFLKEVLMHMASEQVRFHMKDQTHQVLIFEENGNEYLTMLLMPMFMG